MSLQYCPTLISPSDVGALHNLIARAEDGADKEAAYRWLCYARSELFAAWQALPDGHHLKEAYANEVWQWNDEDLASIPEERQVSSEEVRELLSDLERPAMFRRPTPEEMADG